MIQESGRFIYFLGGTPLHQRHWFAPAPSDLIASWLRHKLHHQKFGHKQRFELF
jgi:hypothetical protein